MKRKKIRATKKNKERIKEYKKKLNLLEFCGDKKIKMTCIECKEISVIRTHKPELYTEEVKKNYVCLNCEGRKK